MQAGHKKIQPVKVVHALTVLIVIYCVLHESRPDHMTLCLSVHVAIWSFMLVISYLCSHHMPSFARPTIWNGWADCTNFSIKGTLQLLPRVSNWWWRSRERVPDIGNVEWKSANMFGYANTEGNSHFCVYMVITCMIIYIYCRNTLSRAAEHCWWHSDYYWSNCGLLGCLQL